MKTILCVCNMTCKISFSWCGKRRSTPPQCTSSASLLNAARDIAEHSMCLWREEKKKQHQLSNQKYFDLIIFLFVFNKSKIHQPGRPRPNGDALYIINYNRFKIVFKPSLFHLDQFQPLTPSVWIVVVGALPQSKVAPIAFVAVLLAIVGRLARTRWRRVVPDRLQSRRH